MMISIEYSLNPPIVDNNLLFQCPQPPMVLQETLIAHEATATQAFSDKLSSFLQVDSVISSLVSLKVDIYYISWRASVSFDIVGI